MKASILALVVSISVTTWAYIKLQNHTGYGNASTTVKGAILVFVITFVVVFTLGQIILG